MQLKQLKTKQMNKEVLNKAKALDSKIDYLETLIDLLTQCDEISIKGRIVYGVDEVRNLSYDKSSIYSELQSKLIKAGANAMIDVCEKYLKDYKEEFEKL